MIYYLMKLTHSPKITVASGYSTDNFKYKFTGNIANAEVIFIEKSDIIAERGDNLTVYPTGSLVTLAYDVPGEYTSSDGMQQHISIDSIERLDDSGVVRYANLVQSDGNIFKD